MVIIKKMENIFHSQDKQDKHQIQVKQDFVKLKQI